MKSKDASTNKLLDEVVRRQAELKLSDEEVARAMGYEKATVFSMMKAGKMRIPLNKAADLAAALKMDSFDVTKRLLEEQSPDLWLALSALLPLGQLSATEISLVTHLRALCGGRPAAPIVMSGAGVIALVAVQ